MLPGRVSWPPRSPGLLSHPSALLCFPLRSSLRPRSPHTGFLSVFSHPVVHATSSSKSHVTTLDALTVWDISSHICLSVCLPSLSHSVIPFPLPNQSAVAGDSITCPGHSLARWCKASGIHRRWGSPPGQGGPVRAESAPGSGCQPLLPPPWALGHSASLQCCHQPSHLEGCLYSPLLQFCSACS